MPDFSAEGITSRLRDTFSNLTNDQVVERLRAVGLETSRDTVRRYREGISQRIDASFVGAVAAAFSLDPRWLLTGEGGTADEGVGEALRLLAEADPFEFHLRLVGAEVTYMFRHMLDLPDPDAGERWLAASERVRKLAAFAPPVPEDQRQQIAEHRLAMIDRLRENSREMFRRPGQAESQEP